MALQSAHPPSHVSSGARIVFKLSGQKFAWATRVSWTITHEHLPVYVLDQLEAEEYSETSYAVTFSASGFRVADFSVIGLKFMPKLADILTQPELTATIEDKITGTTLLTVYRVKMIQRSGSLGARDLTTENYDFVGIRAGDEGCAQDPGTSVSGA